MLKFAHLEWPVVCDHDVVAARDSDQQDAGEPTRQGFADARMPVDSEGRVLSSIPRGVEESIRIVAIGVGKDLWVPVTFLGADADQPTGRRSIVTDFDFAPCKPRRRSLLARERRSSTGVAAARTTALANARARFETSTIFFADVSTSSTTIVFDSRSPHR